MKFFKMTKTVSRLQETSKVLSLSNLCTGFIAIGLLFLLYGKNEKIIIVPPNLQTTGWIDENEGSTAYMQSWASYIATLLGNTNPSSVNFVKSSLAPFLSPNSYQRIMLSIDDAISQINRDRVSLTFTPTRISTDPKAKGVYFVEGSQEVKSVTGRTTIKTVHYIVTVYIRGYKPVIEDIQLKNGDAYLPTYEQEANGGVLPDDSQSKEIIEGSRVND